MEKQIIEVFLLIVLIFLSFFIKKKNIVYVLLAILPFALKTRFESINTFIIIGVFFIYLIRVLLTKSRLEIKWTAWMFLASILSAHFFSFFINYQTFNITNLYTSRYFLSLFWIVSCVAIFVMIGAEFKDSADIKKALIIIICAYFVSSISSLLQIINPDQLYIFKHLSNVAIPSNRGIRISGTLGEYELYAEYTAIILVMLLYFFVEFKQKIRKNICAIAMFAAFFLLLMTKTRGGLISFVFVIMYLFILKGRYIVSRIGKINIFIVIIFLLLAGIFNYVFVSKWDSYNLIDQTIVTLKEIDPLKGDFDSRQNVWAFGWNEIQNTDNKFFGRGSGIYSHTKKMSVYPHCLYLYLFLSVGLFGLMSYLFFFLYLFKRPKRKLKKDADILFIFFQAAMLLFLVDEIKIEFFRNSTYQQIIWSFMGLLYAVSNLTVVDKEND